MFKKKKGGEGGGKGQGERKMTQTSSSSRRTGKTARGITLGMQRLCSRHLAKEDTMQSEWFQF